MRFKWIYIIYRNDMKPDMYNSIHGLLMDSAFHLDHKNFIDPLHWSNQHTTNPSALCAFIMWFYGDSNADGTREPIFFKWGMLKHDNHSTLTKLAQS